MRTKYPSFIGVLAVLMLVVSFMVPAKMVAPAPAEALNPICQWDLVDTPALDSALKLDVQPWSEINQLVVGSDGKTMWAVDVPSRSRTSTGWRTTALGNIGFVYKTTNGGISWSTKAASSRPDGYLYRDMLAATVGGFPVWKIAMAPDDVNFVAVVVDGTVNNATSEGPKSVYISEDGGANWTNTGFVLATTLPAGEFICSIAVSPKYGNTRDVMVGTRDNLCGGNVYILKAPGFSAWTRQIVAARMLPATPMGAASAVAEVYDAIFSPTYVGDAGIVIAASPQNDSNNTYLFYGVRDLAAAPPTTTWTNYPAVEIKAPTAAIGSSPGVTQMIQAMIQAPSDFSVQTASMRRVYVSTDANPGALACNTGVYRVDDTTIYELMSTTGMFYNAQGAKRISSISYWGTYASGKLLVGEVKGWACTATVPTWFTDSPTVCPVPCWYPALKPTTGAAGTTNCTANDRGYGNAKVVWSPTFADQGVAYVGTSSAMIEYAGTAAPFDTAQPPAAETGLWLDGQLIGEYKDESAFALTRNNGETWNQLSIIDTWITKFTDVAPAADCSTVYLASTNNNTFCKGFDSVWRSGTNAAVVTPPLPALPLGSYWERVFCHVTAVTCTAAQSEHAILRLAPDKKDGQIVYWAAGGTGGYAVIGGLAVGANTQAVFWTPDYGDYWAAINPRIPVEDIAAASSTFIYILDTSGRVQRMPYTGTAWSSAEATTDAGITGHMILARGDKWVLVGDNRSYSGLVPAAFSKDAALTFSAIAKPTGNATADVHVEWDSKFETNSIIYAGFNSSEGNNVAGAPPAPAAAYGSIYRWQIGTSTDWVNILGNGAVGSVHTEGYWGLAVAYTGHGGSAALYGAHPGWAATALTSGVQRQLYPTTGMPKPGMAWDCLNIFTYVNGTTFLTQFTEEPWSLKLCGCLTMDTDTNLFALDNNIYQWNWLGVNAAKGPGNGDLWMFTDCVAKKGPTLTMADGTLIGCDPVSGRNQEVNFTWEQLCLGQYWDLEIAKDTGFTLRVFDWVGWGTMALAAFYEPALPTSPALIFPVGGAANAFGAAPPVLVSQLECGHKYYWRVQVRACATNQIVRSPWSNPFSFTVKAGLPVVSTYYGLTLLSPSNGCVGCPISPASFSWSPYKETTKYKFVLAKNSEMTDIVAEAETKTTGYEYKGKLAYSTNYFWRVMAVEPAPSDWSATFSFQTAAAPPPPAPAPPAPTTPIWVWVVIAIGALLIIVTLVLIFKTRRV